MSARRVSGRDRTPWQDSRRYRERALELAPRIREGKRRQIAIHEAGHFLVAAYLGEVMDSIGVEVGTLVQMGVVVQATAMRRKMARADVAAMLAAGGLAQQRFGIRAHVGSGSDEQQIAALRLAPSTVERARRRADEILDLVWPDVEFLSDAVMENTVLSGETAISYVLAQRLGVGARLPKTLSGLAKRYRQVVDRSRRTPP